MKKTNTQTSNIIVLLRLCTVLLAAVSFWSTARGMREYTFSEGWQAYAASLGIQGLLLGLNFSLPHFLKQCDEWWQRAALLALSAVVLFCSSWFSYLFIASNGYEGSWDTKSRLMAQEAYRDELLAAQDYVELYDEALDLRLSDQIQELYGKARGMDTSSIDINTLNWAQERADYVTNGGAASSSMEAAIQAMEDAMGNAAQAEGGETTMVSQDVRQNAAEILDGLRTSMLAELDTLAAQISAAESSVNSSYAVLQNAENRMRNIPQNADPTPYQQAINTASNNWRRSVERLDTLQERQRSYQDALSRVNYYASLLGMTEEGVSSYYVGANLREIQRELFQPEPDPAQMLELSGEVFDRLQSAEDLDQQNGAEYQSLLSLMNRFISNLERRRQLKDAGDALQQWVDALANGDILSVDEAGGNRENWKNDWITQINELKSRIGSLPVYSAAGGERGSPLLEDYDRSASVRRLDEAEEQYLTEHNSAEQGLIYLRSAYRMMALFSLALAFLLDIAAFVTGVMIEREESKLAKNPPPPLAKEDNTSASVAPTAAAVQPPPAWTLNQYLFLTSDYKFCEGEYTYRTIEQGKLGELRLPTPNYRAGLYRWEKDGILAVRNAAELLYQVSSGGPQDGVYLNCGIACQGGLLTLFINGTSRFLGNADPYVPVYKMSGDSYDEFPIKDMGRIDAKTVIVALERDGVRIAGVYVVL